MSATPPNGGVPWYKSHAFTTLWQTFALTLLYWLSIGLASNVWNWRQGLAAPLVAALTKLAFTMFSPDVVGPLALMNKSNTGAIKALPPNWKPPEEPKP